MLWLFESLKQCIYGHLLPMLKWVWDVTGMNNCWLSKIRIDINLWWIKLGTACNIYNHVGLSLKEAHCSTFSKGDRENKYLSIQLLLLCFGSIPNLPTLKKASWLQRWKIEKKIVSNVQIRQAIDRVVMNYSIILQSCFLGELEREKLFWESERTQWCLARYHSKCIQDLTIIINNKGADIALWIIYDYSKYSLNCDIYSQFYASL